MKRSGNLYDRICDRDNIYFAYTKAKAGKSRQYGVVLFEKDLENNLESIYHDMASSKYKTSQYDIFKIHDPKERDIYRLPFRDRVVHHAIMNILEEIWNPIFISHTYSCIKGKGIHGALRHIKRDMKDTNGTKYCLKMDIRKFYPSIDHDTLKLIIRKKIKDKKLLKILDEIIDSAPGVPIGNYLSQFFANLYLSYFDHWIKENVKVKYYYRYADDMVILGNDKKYLHSLLVLIKAYMENNLKLHVKDNFQVFPVVSRGVDFVGYVFYHTHTKLRKSIKKNFCRRVAMLNKRDITAKKYISSISSWIGWSKYCDSRNLIKTIIKNDEVLRYWR